MINCVLSQNSDLRNSYSLGENIGYTDWQTAGVEGDINLFYPDSSIATGYEGRSGSWLDKYRLICKHLNSDGTLGNISYTDCIKLIFHWLILLSLKDNAFRER